MKLQEELKNLSINMQSMLTDEIKDLMQKNALDLINSGIRENALKTGDKIPDFILPNATGKKINIGSSVRRQAQMII